MLPVWCGNAVKPKPRAVCFILKFSDARPKLLPALNKETEIKMSLCGNVFLILSFFSGI